MPTLLRSLQRGSDGIAEYQDTEIDTDAVTIGSAADCGLQLLGAAILPRHATLGRAGAAAEIRCNRGARVTVNGKPVESSSLQVDDVVEVGPHRLKLARPPAGFDLAIEIDAGADVPAQEFERAFRTDLEQTWLSKRRASWLLLIAVPLLTLLVPLAGVVLSGDDAPATMRTTPHGLLPSDAFWSSGELIPAHQQATGGNCRSCHEGLFSRVRDESCRECHAATGDHVSPAHAGLAGLEPAQRCAQCHRDHDAPAASLVNLTDALCTGCHADTAIDFASLDLATVEGFTTRQHPAFKASLLRPPGVAAAPSLAAAGDWGVERILVSKGKEISNLRYSHRQHLDPDKVLRRSDSQPLGCGDCHVPGADGEHFAPVSMAKNCSSCHELTFDASAPERQLPHGKPLDAVQMLQDYYVRVYTDPTAREAEFVRRRRPDRQVEEERCTDAPLACGTRRAAREIDTQFTRRGCVSCHEIEDSGSSNLRERFAVRPVRLARDYFVDVRFSHRAHAIQKELTGDAACTSCHAANRSEESTDLMMPDIAKCAECHSGRPETERVTLGCSGCHEYHPVAIIAAQQ